MTSPVPLCAECGDPLECDGDRFWCGNGNCSALGMAIPVWRALKEAGLAAPPSAGWPRPVQGGLPVPWVAARTQAQVWWRALDAERLAVAHNQWRCQVCGEVLPEEAWVLATPDGMVLQAALHEACKDLALEFCPHLSGRGTRARAYAVTRDQLVADGRPLPQAAPFSPYFLQQWELLPEAAAGPQPGTGPSTHTNL